MAHSIFFKVGTALKNGSAKVEDPGASGTIAPDPDQWFNVCEIETATGESRVVANPVDFAVGSELLLTLKEDGGDATITQYNTAAFNTAGATSIVFDDAGESALLRVVDNNGTKQWRIASSDYA